MRVEARLVLEARDAEAEGARRVAFEAIVRAYEGPLYAFCIAQTRSMGQGPEDAEDAVQEVFAKAYIGIRDLREVERFESWLYAVARRELSSLGRRVRNAEARLGSKADLEPDELPAPPDKAEANGALGLFFAALSPEQALAVALRYGAGLSVRETGLACGIDERVAKSRLHEALERMRRARSRLSPKALAAADSPFRIPIGLEERIMENIETLRLGARVLERMAVYDQARLARLALDGERMDEVLLEAMGRIEGGPEFIRRIGARLGMREFASVVNYATRDTEKRLVEELERIDAEAAEAFKRDCFVFEDFTLFDEAALELVVRELGSELFARGLAACEPRERELILSKAGEETRAVLRSELSRLSSSLALSRSAQEESIGLARRLDMEGRIVVLRGSDAGAAGCVVRAAP
jgi:RNA polymerase sigma factor, sigma-70 family